MNSGSLGHSLELGQIGGGQKSLQLGRRARLGPGLPHGGGLTQLLADRHGVVQTLLEALPEGRQAARVGGFERGCRTRGLASHEFEDLAQSAEALQLQIPLHAFSGHGLGHLAQQLGPLDAVDAQIGLEIPVQADHLGGIAGQVDHEVDQEAGHARIHRFRLRRQWDRARRRGAGLGPTALAALRGGIELEHVPGGHSRAGRGGLAGYHPHAFERRSGSRKLLVGAPAWMIGGGNHQVATVQDLPVQSGEYLIGTDFEECTHALLDHPLQQARIADGVGELSHQVLDELGRVGHQAVGHVGVEEPGGRAQHHLLQHFAQGCLSGLHQGGVQGPRNLQQSTLDLLLGETVGQLVEVLQSSAHHRLLGSVVVSQEELQPAGFDGRLGHLGAGRYREKAAVRAGRQQSPGPLTGQRDGLLQGDHARGHHGRDFAETVPADAIRLEPAFAHGGINQHVGHQDGNLGGDRILIQGLPLAPGQLGERGQPGGDQQSVSFGQLLASCRRDVHQLLEHPGIL